MRWPMIGLAVCYKHGGATKAAREKGLRVKAQQDAEKADLRLLASFQAEVNTDIPVIENYDRALSLAVAWLDICTQQLEALTAATFETQAGDRKLDARINLFERALDRVEKFLGNAQHLDLEERKVRVTEAQQAEVAEAWGRATVELFARLRAALAAFPGALLVLQPVEDDAPEMAYRALNPGGK